MSNFLKDYDYIFPKESIAQEPLTKRDASRMLVLSKSNQGIQHAQFTDLLKELAAGDLVVANDTSVIAARLFVQKPSGSLVEVFLLKPVSDLEWQVFLSPRRGLAEDLRLPIFCRESSQKTDTSLVFTSLQNDDFRVRFDSAEELSRIMENYGEPPLPPYIKRQIPQKKDRERYQTLFAKNAGAVAAPTAGLHFSEEFRQQLRDKGVLWKTVTLHVGAGTFLPVKVENVEHHIMHREAYEVPSSTQEAVHQAQAEGKKILAVGTTSMRALESWAMSGRSQGETDLFIRPGFNFKIVNALLTNFHQPQSTLLMLVSAFAEREWILRAYQEAIAAKYRLFSYGDCMLIRP